MTKDQDEIIVFEEPEDVEELAMDLYEPPNSAILSVEAAVQTYDRLTQFISKVLISGVDYDVVPGTKKQTLMQPGAQKMARFFSLRTRTEATKKIEQWDVPVTATTFPVFAYDYVTYVEDLSGNALASVEGSCNSYEDKYRWRWVQYPPALYNPDELLKEEATLYEFKWVLEKEERETTGQWGKPQEYWDEWDQAIADGKVTPKKRKTKSGNELDGYERDGTRYRIPNENIYSQINTLMKMAQKRAYVGAVIYATSTSQYFTQDMEDLAKHYSGGESHIGLLVPSRDDAARKLMRYVASKGVSNAGDFIKQVLLDADVSFSLDNWHAILKLLDETIAAN